MAFLLFPGRHQVLTNYQLRELTGHIGCQPSELLDIRGVRLEDWHERFGKVIWAITSANRHGSARNPLPAFRREQMILEFATQLDVESEVYWIDDTPPEDRLVAYLLKKIFWESWGKLDLSAENTVVTCSEPRLIDLFLGAGFRVLAIETVPGLGAGAGPANTPDQLLDVIARAGPGEGGWRVNRTFLTEVATATRKLYRKYDYGDLVCKWSQSRLLKEDSSLPRRDYNSYARSLDSERVIDFKYDKIKPHLARHRPGGQVVDLGCGTGGMIRKLTTDPRLQGSEFHGVEAAAWLHTDCEYRRQRGHYQAPSDRIIFHLTDVADHLSLLKDGDGADTFLTFSLTHEIYSYGKGKESLVEFLRLLYRKLRPGGMWINYDVVGPGHPSQDVLLWVNAEDGDATKTGVAALSTFQRFQRFLADFRWKPLAAPAQLEVAGRTVFRLDLRFACEFLTKWNYPDNWGSEMEETFCFWTVEDWVRELEQVGFAVAAAESFAHPLREQEWRTHGHLLASPERPDAPLPTGSGGDISPLPFPDTNMVLVVTKPEGSPPKP